MLKIPIHCSAEFKMVEKQKQQTETKHYEPKVQADIRLGKLSLSLGAQSWWTDFEEITNSRYWANFEQSIASLRIVICSCLLARKQVVRFAEMVFVAMYRHFRALKPNFLQDFKEFI
jgi:hypothetical protein